MTLLEAVNRVREILGSDPFWADTDIKNWLNDGYLSFCRKRGIEEQWSSVVYNLDKVPIPSDLFRLFEVYYIPTGDSSAQTLADNQYRIFDNYIHFWQPLNGTVIIEGEKMPTAIGDTDSFELPEKIQIGIVYYAIAVAYLKDEDFISSNQYFALYQQKLLEWERMPTFRKIKWEDNWSGGFNG